MQQDNDRQSTLLFNGKLFQDGNGKFVDKEPNILVVSFIEMSSTRSKTAVVDKNAIGLSLCPRNKDCMS